MKLRFNRIAIVNRGEPAMRLIHAVRELNEQLGAELKTVALYTEPDRNAMFVRESDDRVSLGSATFDDPATGRAQSRYLDHESLKRALIAAGSDAAWVGWGFVAEDPAFADLCRDLFVVFIGPDGDVMRKLGDKMTAKRLASEAGFPVAPWSHGPVATIDEAHAAAAEIGYPLMVKATAGGGGRGIRRARDAQELAAVLQQARSEARAAFGDDTVFLERMIQGARHVEVQIVADRHGGCWPIGVRDCTVQRRHQKIVEEAPCPVLPDALEGQLREAAARLAQTAGYCGVGTVECLYDAQAERFYFMEMNTRLQVEHPVTEATTGIDLVKLQLHVASGGRLEGEPPRTSGHAIEVRLNAEDTDNNFAPAPGRIDRFAFPSGPGLRVDTGISEGDVVPPEFDSMVAKIIAHGRDRSEALARLKRALRECVVSIEGGTTNKAFLLEILSAPDILACRVDIGWLDRLLPKLRESVRPHAHVALLRAAIEVFETQHQADCTQFLASAGRGRPTAREEMGKKLELSYRGSRYKLDVLQTGVRVYEIQVLEPDDLTQIRTFSATLSALDRHQDWLTTGRRRYQVMVHPQGLDFLVEVNGIPHRIQRQDSGIVRSPSPAIVVSVAVTQGQTVAAGDRLVVLEAMKMEQAVVAPGPGLVKSVAVSPNTRVDAAAPLVILEPLAATALPDESHVEGAAVAGVFSHPDDDDPNDADDDDDDSACATYDGEPDDRRLLRRFLPLMLGFDAQDADPRASVRALQRLESYAVEGDTEAERIENLVLSRFVDVLELYEGNAGGLENRITTMDEFLQAYARTIDGAVEGLSPALRDRLQRVLAHYGVTHLRRSPELDDALLWSFKAHKRAETLGQVARSILERRIDQACPPSASADEPFFRLLDRLCMVTQSQHMDLHDVAQRVLYCQLHRPLFERAESEAYGQLEQQLNLVLSAPDRQHRNDQLRVLVDSPHPMTGFLAPWLLDGEAPMRLLMLEALVRRFYLRRQPYHFRAFERADLVFSTGQFESDGRRAYVIASTCSYADVARAIDASQAVISALDARDGDQDKQSHSEIFLELFVGIDREHADTALARDLVAHVRRAEHAGYAVRMSICLICKHVRRAVEYYTFEQSADGPREAEILRGLHAMWVERLELWRLDNFECQRLPAGRDIYLFRAVAKENVSDERLFAFVDVRDLTPITDDAGKLIRLPHLERMFVEVMACLRDAQVNRESPRRLQSNRVLFYLWPPLTFGKDAFTRILERMAAGTQNLGLQKIVFRASMPHPWTGELLHQTLSFHLHAGRLVRLHIADPSQRPIRALTPYEQRVAWASSRRMMYPYEIVRMMTPPSERRAPLVPRGDFVEYDLNDDDRLVEVERPYGNNHANVVVGVIRNFTRKCPEGMSRVIILSDPTREMGALGEPECRRILGALDLAWSRRIPVEWFPISAGARISLNSGTENLDWTARVLRRIVELTQGGGEINIVIDGIDVGAQSYWNAEATMLMHARGILIMTGHASMLLTGKRALDYSGSVSADTHLEIGGIERIMGPNGAAQYSARDITEACEILLQHYDLTYVCPGERFPRRAVTQDPTARDVTLSPHENGQTGCTFSTIGEAFSSVTNPQRKKPFDIRSVMRAVADRDSLHLERWALMRDAESAVVWDVHVGGIPVCMIGVESRPLLRRGPLPGDGPQVWTGGTLFPLAAKKVARALNAASGNRPVLVLANLSGFDGSPESMRNLQLEYGAEIGRAVVNFTGPIVFCVISRYHGGAYVVFSRTLNENIEVAALHGSYASVIGGAPAAAVVLTREVKARIVEDPRVEALRLRLSEAPEEERPHLRAELSTLLQSVRSEKQAEVAHEFDRIHNVERARSVGSLHRLVEPTRLRPYLIDALERGQARTTNADPDRSA